MNFHVQLGDQVPAAIGVNLTPTTRGAMRTTLTCAALLILGLIAVWIRLVPLELLSATDRAARGVRNELERQLLQRLPGPVRSQRAPEIAVIVDRWMRDNRHTIEARMAQGIRAEMTYTAPEGRSYPYLGGFDSYLWLRYARTRLQTGNPCDAIVNGACRDTHTAAPVGSTSPYAQRLHPAAIAELHRVITLFRPGYPLQATAFLISVIVGALGVIPAFFLGRALGGSFGGLFAAVFIAAHPAVLGRTMAGDNDIWNVVLPLYAAWATVAALRSGRPRLQVIYAALASVSIGIEAWAWSGWIFFYTVIVAGCLGTLLLQVGRFILLEKSGRIWRSDVVRRIGVVIVCLYTGSAICASLAASPREYFGLPAAVFGAVKRAIAAEPIHRAPNGIEWPNVLSTVAELAHMRFPDISKNLGGGAVVVIAFLGLVLTALPAGRLHRREIALLIGSGIVYIACLFVNPGQIAAVAIVSAPVLAALVLATAEGQIDIGRQGTACLLAVWTIAALYLTFQGVRFILLLAPPLGLTAASAIGSAARCAANFAAGGPPWYRRITYAALGVVVAIVVSQPVLWGYAVAREYAPEMNDAWWDALTELRDRAAPDAIVHTEWDYGDWVTYVAERRVDNDGTSLLTHIPVWVAKALAAPRERDSVGVLRMLGCGSDLTPLAGGDRGGYGKLLALRHNPLDAYTMLTHLVTLDAEGAEAYLAERGIGPADRANILRSTHCTTPESYLVLSSKLVEKRRSWMAFGLWDPTSPRADAVDSASSDTESGVAVPFLPAWLPCKAEGTPARMTCEIQAKIQPWPELFEQFVAIGAGAPRLISRRRWRRIDGPPALLIQAEKDAIHETRFAASPYPNLGVLVDGENNRMLIGNRDFLRSTFVQLMYLDGRYEQRYEKFDERAVTGERVVTWKINWQAEERSRRLN